MFRFFRAVSPFVGIATAMSLGIFTLAFLGMTANAIAQVIAPAVDPVVAWYAYVCGDDGVVFKFLAHALYPSLAIVVAAIAANSKTVQGLPVIGPLVNFVALNWATWLRSAAAKAAAKTPLALMLAIGLLSLQACTKDQLTVAIADAQKACAIYAPVSIQLGLAPIGSGPAVTKGYVDGACDLATGQLTPAGVAAVTKDPATASWITAGSVLLQGTLAVLTAPESAAPPPIQVPTPANSPAGPAGAAPAAPPAKPAP